MLEVAGPVASPIPPTALHVTVTSENGDISSSQTHLPNPDNKNSALMSSVFLSHNGQGSAPITVTVTLELLRDQQVRLVTSGGSSCRQTVLSEPG